MPDSVPHGAAPPDAAQAMASPDRDAALAPRRLAVLLLLATGFVAYVSLWPFRWHAPPAGADLLGLLVERMLRAPPGGRGDVLANLVLYAPPALILGLLLPARWPAAARLALPALAGLLLSAGLESAQLLDAGRVSSGRDVLLNTLGALAGACFALAAGRRLRGGVRAARLDLVEPFAALVVLAWLGWRFYPYVPALDLQAWKDSLKPLLRAPLEPMRLATLLASWTSAALLAELALGQARARWLVPLMLAAGVAAEVAVPSKVLDPAEALALAGALAAWLLLRGRAATPWVMAAAMLFALLVERLAPFTFSGPPRAFGWIPFASLVGGSLGAGMQAILAKSFLDGATLVWLCRCGLALPRATMALAALVLAASLAQCWLPGRSAEVTDTVLVLCLALTWHMLRPMEASA